MELTPTEIWEASAEGLHTKEYVEDYIDALEFILRDKNLKILDTACGTGFPLVQLYKRGFKNIEASDSDRDSVKKLKGLLEKSGVSTSIYSGLWQEMDCKVGRKFDVILNTDNSFVYMDGWDLESENSKNNFKTGKDHAFNRAKLVLSNFYNSLEDGGFAVIGLGKHYELPSRTYETPLSFSKDGKTIDVKWVCSLDWETREHVWKTLVSTENSSNEIVRKSYLYTKYELAQLIKDTGFKKVHIIEPDSVRDNLIVGIK